MPEVCVGERMSDRDMVPQSEARDEVRVFSPETNSVGWGTAARAGLRRH